MKWQRSAGYLFSKYGNAALFAVIFWIVHSSIALASEAVPSEFRGYWGSDESCRSYNRGSLYYRLDDIGRFSIVGVEKYGFETPKCAFRQIKSTDDFAVFGSSCADEITIEKRASPLRMTYRSVIGQSIFMHKCGAQDIVNGIGIDTSDIGGELGRARHITFTFGYATYAAAKCGLQFDGRTTERILDIGREAAQRYALTINALPPENWAKRFAEKRVFEGWAAAEADFPYIQDYCAHIFAAYGQSGHVVDGLLK